MAYNDVRQTASKKDCDCSVCKKAMKKGEQCYVDPKEGKAWHASHGKDKTKK